MMNAPSYVYSHADKAVALILTAVILLLCLGSLNYSCIWGDDSAAYISEGIAIAEGRFKEHIKLTPIMHPSFLSEEITDELVYVWGYPLLLSAVYLIDGFDTDNYSNIIAYKLPSAVFLAVMALCLFLLLRKRFSLAASAFAAFLFCTAPLFCDIVNSLYSDIVYTGMCMLTLFAIECYLEKTDRRSIILGSVTVGVLMWYSAEVRVNGAVLVAVLAVGQLDGLIKGNRLCRGEILPRLLPYAVFLALRLVFEYLIFRPVTSNPIESTFISTQTVYSNAVFYTTNLAEFVFQLFYNLFASLLMWFPAEKLQELASPFYVISRVLGWLTLALTALGIVTDGIKSNRQLTLYVVGCFIGSVIFPFNQGLRYLLGIMPVMVIFALYGAKRVFSLLFGKLPAPRSKGFRLCLGVVSAVLCLASCCTQLKADIKNIGVIRANGEDIHAHMEEMYSPCAVEMYDYIKENTAPNALILFHKPRALYLNTGRLAFSNLVSDRSALDADYCVLSEFFYNYYLNEETPDWFNKFEPVLHNNELTVMKKIEEA